MKNILVTLLSTSLVCCTPTLEVLAPAATPNPLILAGVPLCVRNLTPIQFEKVQAAAAAWNTAFPPLGLELIQNCPDEMPFVQVADLPEDRCAITTPAGITFKSDECLTQCVANHEMGHWAGLVRHAPENEPGAMSDGDRGDCLPSAQDEVLLIRTYLGRVSP